MILKTITKLFLFTAILATLGSCVNNKDQVTVKPDENIVELTPKSLSGKWEIYFWNKTIIPTSTNIPTKYRFTEEDGFSITFLENGTYHENNVFGMKTIDGKYLIGNYKDDDREAIWDKGPQANKKKDGLFLRYYDEKLKRDSLRKAEIPQMYETHFAFRHRYGGVEKNNPKNGYRVEDIKYYRNVQKAPNYMPTSPEFHKNMINMNDLLGRWQFYNYKKIVNGEPVIDQDAEDRRNKDFIVYRLENGKQIYEEHAYLIDKETQKEVLKLVRKGEFKIIDDVVNMMTNSNGTNTIKTESFKHWIKEPIANSNEGFKLIRSYDRALDGSDLSKDVTTYAFYKRIGDK